MGDQSSKKSGGSRKIGRNKTKCQAYRYKQKGWRVEGNKHPKGIGLRKPRPEKGYVDDLARMSEDKVPEFRPRFECAHLSTELLEADKGHRVNRGRGTFKENAQELARHIRPVMRHQVLFLPERPKRPSTLDTARRVRPRVAA